MKVGGLHSYLDKKDFQYVDITTLEFTSQYIVFTIKLEKKFYIEQLQTFSLFFTSYSDIIRCAIKYVNDVNLSYSNGVSNLRLAKRSAQVKSPPYLLKILENKCWYFAVSRSDFIRFAVNALYDYYRNQELGLIEVEPPKHHSLMEYIA